MWSARVHKTGTKIQLLKNGSVSKTIEASEDTFAPYEAQKFAEDLIGKMNNKVAKQMKDPGAKPDVSTEGETHNESLAAAIAQATGKAVKDASSDEISKVAYEKMAIENKSLKKKIAKVEKEAHIERKARRGVAIAKALVEQKKLANDEAAIKETVMNITAMSNDEINLLERKAANKPLYDSAEDANKASRRYARMSRLHIQAAEDAQIGGEEALADGEDLKAAHYDRLSKEAYNEAGKYSEAGYNSTADTGTSEDIANQIKNDAKGISVDGKQASDKSAGEEIKPEIDDIMFQAEDGEEDEILDDDVAVEDELPEEDQFEEEDEEGMNMTAAAKIYHKIASDHTAKADALKKEGNDKEAETETEIAKEATELAQTVETKIAETKEASEKEATEKEATEKEATKKEASIEESKKAVIIYRKIAATHKKKAEELELEGKTAEADIEDEICTEAEKMAEDVESYMKKESEEDEILEEEVTDEILDEEVTDDLEAAVEDTSDDLETTDEVIGTESAEEDTNDDAILENTAMESVITDSETDEMPTEEEIAAALNYSNDEEDALVEDDAALEEVASEENEIEASDDGTEKEADNKGTRKIAEITKIASSDVDREEANRYSGQVTDLENLWN